MFWKGHDPTSNSRFLQYRAVIFYHNDEQMKLAIETRDLLASETKGRIATAIEPYSGFYIAEDYHQKHSLRSYPEIMMEIRALYPDVKSLITSTAVTRINGYLGGYGSCDSLGNEIEGFGLSLKTRERLTAVVCSRKARIACPVL